MKNLLKNLLIIFIGTFIYTFLGMYLFFDFQKKTQGFFESFFNPSFLKIFPERATSSEVLLPVVIHPEKRTAKRGLYITWYTAQNKEFFKKIREQAKEVGLNTLVIDVKDYLGPRFAKLAKNSLSNSDIEIKPDIELYHLFEELHQEGFIVSARVVVFKDDYLSLVRPDLAVRMKNGGFYRDLAGGRWLDPYSTEVQLYNQLIAETAAASGADEIQLDYIRFPAEGEMKNIIYPFEKEGISKVEIITQFLKELREKLNYYNVSLAVDIFGVTAWQSEYDIKNLGQDLKKISEHVDVIAPMLYPSHFHRGYDGYSNPGAEPYYFVYTGVKKARDIIGKESQTQIIPWIQGFNLRSPNFGPKYILEQIKAGQDAGSNNFLIWNAGNNYTETFSALKQKFL